MWRGRLAIQPKNWQLIFKYLLTASLIKTAWGVSAIEELEGEAGFRMASLQWKYPHPSPTPVSFRVRYCEMHNWGLHRCRYQEVTESEEKPSKSNRTGRQEGSIEPLPNDIFLIEIGGLKMATTYTFQVFPQDSTIPRQIALQTKGFSAKATKCLANSSEVLVETGPFFGGRISVEAAEETPGCFLNGDPQSPQTKYTLQIHHDACGSVVNGSKVTTVILVQENVPILTHSTRKFIVLCSFAPVSFTVKAGVSLPRDTNVAKALDFSKLVRISPQNSSILVADKELVSSSRVRSSSQLPLIQIHDHEDDNSLVSNSNPQTKNANDNRENVTIPTPSFLSSTSLSRRQGRAYESGSVSGGHGQSSEQMLKQSEGSREFSWESYLVSGIICLAIVASLSSVAWFINSARRSGHGTSRLEVDISDAGSQVSSTFSQTDDLEEDGFPREHRSPHNLDTRSELEVELDFEFSEERNSSPFHLQLDYQNHEPTSHA